MLSGEGECSSAAMLHGVMRSRLAKITFLLQKSIMQLGGIRDLRVLVVEEHGTSRPFHAIVALRRVRRVERSGEFRMDRARVLIEDRYVLETYLSI